MTSQDRIRRALDRAVQSERYRAKELCEKISAIGGLVHLKSFDRWLRKAFDDRTADVIAGRLIRFAFLIEPVNEKVTSTKYATRWSGRLVCGDPRRASFESCVAILNAACDGVQTCTQDPGFRRIVSLLPEWGISQHEVPVDYLNKQRAPIHAPKNVSVLKGAEYLRLLRMRQSLLARDRNDQAGLFATIIDKVHVKSYLTDRAQTGDYKTNREKRWEAHPMSPQFALRQDCLMVELALLDQLVGFEEFPAAALQRLTDDGVLLQPSAVSRCPVTLEPMNFSRLADSVENPEHGKSAYQVGHCNPLKAGDSPEFRHTATNISWISADGNRIQGSLPLETTRALIRKIAANYRAEGLTRQS